MLICQHFMANFLRPIILAFELSLMPRPQSALFTVVKKRSPLRRPLAVCCGFVIVSEDVLRAIIVSLHISDEVASEVVRFVSEHVLLCSRHNHIFHYLRCYGT